MLSFIIPAYNEELELPLTLASVHAAAASAHRPYEIVVVDDGSTDETAALARQAGARVIPINRRQIAAARNAGARAAKGDVLFFVDADTQISSGHVFSAVRALLRGCAGGGARVVTDGKIPRWARISVYLFCRIYFAANLGAGAFLFTTRANFDRVGGFDEQFFAGEEVYFSLALKKLGHFVMLDEPVLTSGRKLRMYSSWHVLSRSLAIIAGGQRAVRSRRKLDLWYDGKREQGAG
ncbi:MAG TPA: glycosyltransferase [Chthoniobacterales bacterium]|nr:glycosyltransferase [Chthoniobacterales bacterium]